MARYAFRTQRLYVDNPLNCDAMINLDKSQMNYVLNVMRMKTGDEIFLINGKDGEWLANLNIRSKRDCTFNVDRQVRPQPMAQNLNYWFAPLKQARLDYMVQKATEMGVSSLCPILTHHTQVTRVNEERMAANAREAVEQCGLLSLPSVHAPQKLEKALYAMEQEHNDKTLVFCDEGNEGDDPIEILKTAPPIHAVLIGPEGGFSESERKMLNASKVVTAIPLGPRILRADTAAVAALTLIQAVRGDWITS